MSAEALKKAQVSNDTAFGLGFIVILWIIALIIYAFVIKQNVLGGNLVGVFVLTFALWMVSRSLSKDLLAIYEQ